MNTEVAQSELGAGCAHESDAVAGCGQGSTGGTTDACGASDNEAGCFEVSEVKQAAIDSKERPQTIRGFESALRGLGFTRSEAANLARHGWRGLDSEATCEEAEPFTDAGQPDELRTALMKLEAVLRKGIP